jgi:putative Holliday junction resolvase
MNEAKNILALDVGDARIGVAVANTIARMPNPLTILPNGPKVFHEIESLVREHDISSIVVGLPRDMSGGETEQTEASRRFADNLKGYVKVPMSFADESLSSKRAEQHRSELKRNPKEPLDDVAACFILEEHFRSQND